MSRFRLHILVILGVSLASALLPAQERAPVSLEGSAGVGIGHGSSTFRDRTGIALDATLAWRIRPAAAGAVLVALTGGVQGSPDATDLCTIAPNGGCVPAYPLFYSVGALAGREWARTRGASARVLAGPAYYRASPRSGGGGAFGLQARVDLTTPALWRVALLGSLRGAVLPSYGGGSHALGAVGLGVRVQ
jgi:hypothetical protein